MSSGCRPFVGLVIFFAICFLAAGIGTIPTAPQIPGWYAALSKPAWTPPNWIYGPVWSALYALMAVSGWLIWMRSSRSEARWPLILGAVQLVVNVVWSWLFFGLESPLLGFLDILALMVAIVATITAFWRRSRLAALLLVPYLAWVTCAAVLNFAIWRLNG